MLSFLKDALKVIITISFILGLIVFGFLGYTIFELQWWDETLGIIVGVIVGFIIQTLSYGVIATIISIADTNEEILKALTKQGNTLKTVSNGNSVKGENSWVCSKCGTINPNATTICKNCKS